MAQNVYSSIDPTIVGGIELADILDNFKNALMSGLKGPNRPSQTTAGGLWVDDSVANRLTLKLYTGTTDVPVFTINTTTSTVSIQGSDDFFEITKISEDAVAPYVSFFKRRTSGNGQVKSGDVVGEMSFKAASNTPGVSYVIGRIRYVASNDVTNTTQGGYFVFEGTTKDTAAMTEFARFVNRRLGIGVDDPQAAIHVRSNTGIISERMTDDAVGPVDTMGKSRVSSLGQVKSGDELGTRQYTSKDIAGTSFTAAREVVTATEDHTAVARGVKISNQSIDKGTSAIKENFNISESGLEMQIPTILDGLEKKTQLFASTAEVLALSAEKSFIEVTGATAMTLKGILSTSKSKSFVLYNATDKNITVANKAVDAAPADRIAVNGETSLTVQPGKSVEFVRRNTVGFWSPLVEGNTGITYNEATDLLARSIAKSWLVINQVTIGGSFRFPNAVTAVGGSAPGVATINQTTDRVTVAARMSFDGPWGGGNIVSSDWAGSAIQDELLKRCIAIPSGSGFTMMAVRPGATKKAIFAIIDVAGGFGTDAWESPSVSLFSAGSLSNPSNATLDTMALRDVATNGSVYVVVASSGAQRVGKSSSAIGTMSWAYTPSSVIDVPLYSIAFGNGVWVAVGGVVPGGSPNHAAWVSPDALLTWNSYAMPNETTVQYTVVRFCGSQFVAIGGTPGVGMTVLTSPDGQVWTPRYTAPVGLTLSDVAYGGGLTLISTTNAAPGATGGKIIYSTDGISFVATDGPSLKSIACHPGMNFFGVSPLSRAAIFQSSLTPNF